MSAEVPSDADVPQTADTILHASAVALNGRAALMTGPSGSGKSALALQLLALGARLVSDDRVVLRRSPGGGLVASAPEAIRGLIEARGVGLLETDAADEAPVALAIDLGTLETDRLPPFRTVRLLGVEVPLLHKVESAHFPAAVMLYLRTGRSA